MNQKGPANAELRIDKVRQQFEDWRRSRGKRGVIPQALWEDAVSLFPEYSLNKISRALRLSYTGLKHRVQAQGSFPPSPGAFVELDLSEPAECVVEMKDQNGATMRMYFKSQAGVNLSELGKAFWSRP